LLNPFWVLLAQGVVNLVLKLDVSANFSRAARRHIPVPDGHLLKK